MTVYSATARSEDAVIDRTDTPPARFTARRQTPSTAVISVEGDIDAANAPSFADYALHHCAGAQRVVIDLTEVNFFATAGFSALEQIDEHCGADGANRVLVASGAVSRLLRLCDLENTWRTCYSVAAALSALNGKTPLLQLITKPH